MSSLSRRLWGVAVITGALLLAVSASGRVVPPDDGTLTELTTDASGQCHPVNPGPVTRDSEVVFGRYRDPLSAALRLRRVRRSGFRRARIEREDCSYEVAIIFLDRYRAERIARRARGLGWRVRVMVS